MSRWPLIILCLGLIACGAQTNSHSKRIPLVGLSASIRLGQTPISDVATEMGEPLETYAIPAAVVNTYSEGRSLKFKDNVVKAYFRNPQGDEIHLQHWLQLWKDRSTKRDKLAQGNDAHGQNDYQLISGSDHTTVIFDNESGRVKRVMHYAP